MPYKNFYNKLKKYLDIKMSFQGRLEQGVIKEIL